MNIQSHVDTHLPSPWLRLARWLVIVLAMLALAAAIGGVALYPSYAYRHLPEFTPNDFWTYEQTQAGLAQLGWPSTTMVWVQVGRSLFLSLGVSVVGLFILWRKSRDWFGLYLAFVFLGFGLGSGNLTLPLVEKIPGYEAVINIVGAIGWQLFFIILYFFPNGKPVPGWTRWTALAWGGFIAVYLISPETANNSLGWLAFPFVFSALGSQIYRYFWRADAVQRQQTKWITASVVVILATFGLIIPGAFDLPIGPDYGTLLIQATIKLLILNTAFLLFPIAIAISILRYRLWDIDVLIRRTLQYSLLSGVLALTYFGLIIVLQNAFTAITRQRQNDFVTVVSTLAIAALFNPVRRRVQDAIDRRFYRKKYDAAKTLAAFAATCRDETDLDKLTASLVEVVQETMQPEHVSLWLKPTQTRPDRSRASGPVRSEGGGQSDGEGQRTAEGKR